MAERKSDPEASPAAVGEDRRSDDRTGDAPRVRPARGPRDMLISLLVLLLPVLVLFAAFQWVTGGGSPTRVDQEPALSAARASGLEAVAPRGLDDGWAPVSAVFQEADGGLTVRLGYLTPNGAGIQVVQSTVPVDALLEAELGAQARQDGEVTLATGVWRAYHEVRGGPERALVRLGPDRTTLVVGPASEAELRTVAAAIP